MSKTLCLQCLKKIETELWEETDSTYYDEPCMRCPNCKDIQTMDEMEEYSGY